MAFERVCSLAELGPGEMEEYEVAGEEILVIHTKTGLIRAIPASCPHQDQPLVEGELDGNALTCSAHLWQFDVESGKGINPDDAALVCIPVKVENGEVYVDLDAKPAA